ncbi:hypothetical protein DQ04_05161010 [Trypanosoma grayi]|uniref:hypothetical protein n=1 Tax=Trypanosoma grayi TaxID=71804 RepID=UPI0004F4BB2D|nr:hypothetical protein DQ04_05161010 [Trypanosoma grayi]KEG09471.1 hypothetical protein DQ04_05161010 [Trypanosoma grayi]
MRLIAAHVAATTRDSSESASITVERNASSVATHRSAPDAVAADHAYRSTSHTRDRASTHVMRRFPHNRSTVCSMCGTRCRSSRLHQSFTMHSNSSTSSARRDPRWTSCVRETYKRCSSTYAWSPASLAKKVSTADTSPRRDWCPASTPAAAGIGSTTASACVVDATAISQSIATACRSCRTSTTGASVPTRSTKRHKMASAFRRTSGVWRDERVVRSHSNATCAALATSGNSGGGRFPPRMPRRFDPVAKASRRAIMSGKYATTQSTSIEGVRVGCTVLLPLSSAAFAWHAASRHSRSLGCRNTETSSSLPRRALQSKASGTSVGISAHHIFRCLL